MFMKRAFAVFVLVANISFAQQSATSSQPSSATASDLANLPFRNPALPIDERVNDLISRMTLEEKVSQMRDHAAGDPAAGRSASMTGGTKVCMGSHLPDMRRIFRR